MAATPSYGWKAFAGFLIIITGVFNFFDGLIAVTQESYFNHNLPLTEDIKTWGWVVLAFGVVLILAGLGILAGQTWARLVGVFAASLNAMIQLAYINHAPGGWSLVVILVDILVIYAIVVHGGREDEAML